jgi:thioester reductase-like protein
LKAPNVDGTREILRLAARHRTVPLHYVSSTGVFAQTVSEGVPIRVDDPTGPPALLTNGYRQSKWVAEQVIGLARQRGLPISVYRVDVISGDQANGACQTRDFVWLNIKGLLQAAAVPTGLAGTFHLVPVDFVSAAILKLSARAGRTFHIYNDQELGFNEIVACLRSVGYALDEVDWDSWIARVRADRENAMLPLLDTFEAMAVTGTGYLPIDASETKSALAGTGLECPPVAGDLLARYVRFFISAGYFPQPGLVGLGTR